MSTEQFRALIQQAKQLSAEERKELIKYLSEAEREGTQTLRSRSETDYLALFGSGRGAFATSEEADDFIREERDSWDN